MIIERIPEIMKLTYEEQRRLYGELAHVLATSDRWQELSPEAIAELDRQMDEYHADPSTGCSWEELKTRVQAGEWMTR